MTTSGTVMFSVKFYVDGTLIEQVEELPIPAGKINKIDLTNQDSGFGMEFTTGRFDPGETSCKGVWAAGLPGITVLRGYANDRKLHSCQVVLPDTTTISFMAYIGTFRITNNKDKASYECDIVILGIPTIATTTASLTTLSTATGSCYFVPVAVSPGQYVVTVPTGTSTVSVTIADSTPSSALYKKDSSGNWTTATSPVSVSLGSAGTQTTLSLRVTEPSAADAIYTIIFARASS